MNNEEHESNEPALIDEAFDQLQVTMDQRRADLSNEWLGIMRAQLVAAPTGLTKSEARAILFESWMVGKLAELQVIAKIALDRTLEPKADQ